MAVLTAIAGLVLAIGFDRWYSGVLNRYERERVRGDIEPFAVALEGVFNRRLGRLAGVAAFASGHPSRGELLRELPAFADGLVAVAPDVRAVQLNRRGRIEATYPARDSARLVGQELLRDGREGVSRDIRRAAESGAVVITGPTMLLQGGLGVIMRQRLDSVGPGMPDMATMVLDLEMLLQEAESAPIPAGIHWRLLDRSGRPLRANAESLAAPVRQAVQIGDGAFLLEGAPANGWASAIRVRLLPTRIASVVIVWLAVWIAWGTAGARVALLLAVDERTRALTEANKQLLRASAERITLEERLLHSQKMEAIGTLAGGVAHDFNNLLTAILGFTQLADARVEQLLSACPPAESVEQLRDVHDELDEIQRAANRAALLTAQLLAFSRRQMVKATALDVNVVVNDLERMLQRLIGETMTLVTDVPDQPLAIFADGSQVAQIVVNLVVNARDALPQGGLVRLSATACEVTQPESAPFPGLAAGRWVLLSVKDNGIGMSADVQARMFEPFFTTKPVGQGTGLGLSMVYGIVTHAGGQLFVESAVGVGTTVTIAWPAHDGAVEPERLAMPGAPRERRALVLVVEDEPGLRRLVAEILRRRGHEVRTAEQGEDALEQLCANLRPALIITDIVMPKMGGLELAAALRARGNTTPVLFMSGYPAGVSLPVDTSHVFIDKPFTAEALLSVVQSMIGPEVFTEG